MNIVEFFKKTNIVEFFKKTNIVNFLKKNYLIVGASFLVLCFVIWVIVVTTSIKTSDSKPTAKTDESKPTVKTDESTKTVNNDAGNNANVYDSSIRTNTINMGDSPNIKVNLSGYSTIDTSVKNSISLSTTNSGPYSNNNRNYSTISSNIDNTITQN